MTARYRLLKRSLRASDCRNIRVKAAFVGPAASGNGLEVDRDIITAVGIVSAERPVDAELTGRVTASSLKAA